VDECSFCADGVDLVYGLVAMGSSSTSEIDVYQLAKHKGATRANPDN